MAAVAVMGFTSCNKENAPEHPAEGHKAVLNITLNNPAMKETRVAGAAPINDNTVQNFSVFVIDENGDATWKTHVIGSGPLTDFEVTTHAKRIYIIANAGDQTANYDTRAELEAAKIDLAPTYATRWATVNTVADLSFTQSGGVWSVTANLTLQFVAARITVKVDNQMTGYTKAGGTVIITDIMLLNARGQSKLFPGDGLSSLIPAAYDTNKKYLEGMAEPATPFANYPANGEFTVDATNLKNDYTFMVTPTTSDFYFYVYENDATMAETFPTIITLAGVNVNGDPVYFPVHLAPYETWKSGTLSGGLVRGYSYDLKITLTGDATIGNGGGVEDPTLPDLNATLDVTLTIADWQATKLEKEF